MPSPISPLYKRLPPGPHRLAREEVARHQRMRLHGAMIEAVSRGGYDATTVRLLTGLAGVSRRSFYELFANKQECFLATFDLLAERSLQRFGAACLSGGGDLEQGLAAACEQCAWAVARERKAALLVLLESPTAGAAGMLRLLGTLTACERLLGRALARPPHAAPLPGPVVRALVGGLHGALCGWLRAQETCGESELAGELLAWTLALRVREATRIPLGAAPLRRPPANAQDSEVVDPPRSRLLVAALALAARHERRALTPPQLAAEAHVSIEEFFACFADVEECFLAAHTALAARLRAIAASAALASPDWPSAVRRALRELLHALAARPLHARALALEATLFGPRAVRANEQLARDIAALLADAAPTHGRGPLLLDAIAGAIMHTLRCHVAGGVVEQLPAASDPLAYAVLAPFLGAERALAALAARADG